jgi:hypothetical protein
VACSRSTLTSIKHCVDALLRRLKDARSQLGVKHGIVVALPDLDGERVPAGLDDGDEVLEARLLAASFPSRNLRALATQTLGKLRLSQPSLEPSLPNHLSGSSRHEHEAYRVLTQRRVTDRLRHFV